MKKNPIPCYYISMKYHQNHKETLQKILPPIQNVWEVKIQQDVWEKIQSLAQTKEVTYSWIVRFCVFRAITTNKKPDFDVENPTATGAISASAGVPENETLDDPEKKLHRHKLCLYGEDEKLLRISAMEQGITVSAFIRLCLDQFLGTIENVEYAELFSKGIKLGKEYNVRIHYRSHALRCGFPSLIMHHVVKFSQKEWWKVPNDAHIPLAA